MTEVEYAELVHGLFPRSTRGIRWGLGRTRRVLAELGDPHKKYRVIHVGGTNGKGSVATALASVLRSAGMRVGLFTSPHLCSFRERIQIDGAPITETALLQAAAQVRPIMQRETLSFFEAATSIGLLAMAEADVELAVVEVGLGGRLDATNVVDPELVVITNVAMDHSQYLGDNLSTIAREKAGIIKEGVPVITAEGDSVLQAVFRQCALRVGAPFHVLEHESVQDVSLDLEGTSFRLQEGEQGSLALRTALIGGHQATNMALAVSALRLLPDEYCPSTDAIAEGLEKTRLFGRMQVEEIRGQRWVFDVAHNPAGIQALTRALQALSLPRPLVVLVGILGDKDYDVMLPPLFHMADAAVLTVPSSAPQERCWDPGVVAGSLAGISFDVVMDFPDAVVLAGQRAAGTGGSSGIMRDGKPVRHPADPGTVVVTGSFHTVGDALALLDRAPVAVDPPLPVPGSVATF